jgi:hypothetical protein
MNEDPTFGALRQNQRNHSTGKLWSRRLVGHVSATMLRDLTPPWTEPLSASRRVPRCGAGSHRGVLRGHINQVGSTDEAGQW